MFRCVLKISVCCKKSYSAVKSLLMKAGSREKLFDMLLYQSLSQGVNNPKPGTDAYVD